MLRENILDFALLGNQTEVEALGKLFHEPVLLPDFYYASPDGKGII